MTDIKDFETALKELEEIVNTLERGSMPLEDALKSFEKGVGLARHCATLLDQAEKRVKLLTQEGSEEYLQEEWQAEE
jgi:exodeoxyribonuclease VII small subunit